jgi:FlgD Ig-like domain
VTAALIAPDGGVRPFEADVDKQPGIYSFTQTGFDMEGTWHWNVVATDDLGRRSSIDRPFQYDLTLSKLVVPKSATVEAGLPVQFTLSRPARAVLRIETKLGTPVRTLPAAQLPAGLASLRWDGRLTGKTLAFPGAYVARVTVTSEVGKMDLAAPFALRK